MYYDIPSFTDPMALFRWVNTVTDGWLGPLIVIATFVVFFLAMKRFPTEKAFSASVFVANVVCALLFVLEITTFQHLFFATLMTMVSVILVRSATGSK